MRNDVNAQKSEAEKCPNCDSRELVTGPGSGPHYAALECAECGRHIRWLPKPRETRQRGTDGPATGPVNLG